MSKAATSLRRRRPTSLGRAEDALAAILDALAPAGSRRRGDSSPRALRSMLRRWHCAGEILGYGAGAKVTNGSWTGESALQIHVRRKRPLDVLPPGAVVPRVLSLPGLPRPVLTDVVEREPFRAGSLTGTERPVFPGLSVGHCITGETGSLGAVVTAFGGTKKYLLSAGHVLSASGRGRVDDQIVQPGGVDGGKCPASTVARLRVFVTFKKGNGYPNVADAALATIDSSITAAPGGRKITRLAKRTDVAIHDVLYRTGCRTGERTVLVLSTKHATNIEYPLPSGGRASFGFRDLILYQDFSRKGDSGGPVLTKSGALVGLHIARVESTGHGLAMPVWSLPGEWKISL